MGEMRYYSQNGIGYDLPIVLNRAGVRWFWSFQDIAFVAESRFVSRYSALAATGQDALESFCTKIQEPNRWRAVAHEFLAEVSEFDLLLADATMYPLLNLNFPGNFWDEIIRPLFVQAYQEPRNSDAISRICRRRCS
jgi:hypothetical protein